MGDGRWEMRGRAVSSFSFCGVWAGKPSAERKEGRGAGLSLFSALAAFAPDNFCKIGKREERPDRGGARLLRQVQDSY